MSRRCVSASRRGFTLIELLVVISIVALLMSLLLPTLEGARELQRFNGCNSNLRQLWMSLNVYGNDNREFFPSADAVGNFATRMGPGKVTPGSGIAGAEIYGLPALFDRLSYAPGNTGAWLCPGSPQYMRAWGSTYNYSVNAVISTKKRDRLQFENVSTGLLFDNVTATPAVTGQRGPAHTGGTWTVPTGSVWATSTWSTTIPTASRAYFHRLPDWNNSVALNANWLYPNGRSKLLYKDDF